MGRSPVWHGDAVEDEVLALVREHAAALLRIARRYSICADDAQDAYQRALEKLVRRLRGQRPDDGCPVHYTPPLRRGESARLSLRVSPPPSTRVIS